MSTDFTQTMVHSVYIFLGLSRGKSRSTLFPGFLHCSGIWLIFFICSEFYIENMPCCISNIIAVLTEHNEHSTNARYSHQIEVEVDGGTGSKTVLGRLGLGVIAVFSFHAQLL